MLQQQFEKMKDLKSPQWLQQLRQQNFAAYENIGLPTFHDETWKYTNIKILSKKNFNIASAIKNFNPVDFIKLPNAINVFLINGYFHSVINNNSSSVTISSLTTALEQNLPRINILNQLATNLKHGFAKLNSAFIHDGLYMHLEKNVILEQPIHVFYINTESNSVQYLRNFIFAETGSHATIVEHYLASESEEYLTNTISEIHLAKNTNINHLKLQDEAFGAYHIGTTKVSQAADSHFQSTVISLGGKLSRSDTEIALTEPGSECQQHGLYLGQQRQHFDHHTLVDHLVPHCNSKQLYKGILDNAARAVFNGKVYVHPNAIKSDSSQMTKNLLLSDQAEVDAKPELEIYNDDVKCSHGATVGQLDKNQLFYMLARGLDFNTAKSLLMYAFCYEIIATLKNPDLITYLQKIILQKLPAGITVKELLQ